MPDCKPVFIPVPDHLTRLKIAAAAGCDPKTVLSFFRGRRKTHHMTRVAIEAAMRELGLTSPQVTP
jgi:DNA-binding LacI/PurR family transcriptional regulator